MARRPPAAGATEGDNTIHLDGKGGGNLISKNEYSNFEMEWEWKVNPKGNNGMKYWVTKIGGKEWLGIEYQMIDDSGHPDGLKGGSHTTASIYDIKEPVEGKLVKPAGEWNTSKIVVQDGKIQHWLNGALACEADTTTPEWKDGRPQQVQEQGRLCPRQRQDHADRARRRDLVPEYPSHGEVSCAWRE